MTRHNLELLLGYNQFVIENNTKDVTQDESLSRPDGGGNCMNWILGHIVATRSSTLRLLGAEPVLSEDACKRYERGAPALGPDSDALTMTELMEAAKISHDRIREALECVTAESLERTTKPDGKNTVGDSLVGLHFHEAYHAGQLGLLRSMLGKSGTLT